MRFGRVLALAFVVGLSGVAGAPALEGVARAQPNRAWLGVELGKGDGGVLAKHVVRNSPAAKAGLVDGDLVLAADGVSVEEPKQLVARVAIVGPNNPMSLKVRHAGAERTLSATLRGLPRARRRAAPRQTQHLRAAVEGHAGVPGACRRISRRSAVT